LELADREGLTVQEVRVLVKEEKKLLEDGGMVERLYTPYGENIFYVSTKWQDSREDSYHVIKDGDNFPTLKRRSWFYHEDGREFSLREYAQVQDFPDSFKFVGTYEKIKDQIGNAVSPKMAKYVGKKLKGKTVGDIFAGCGGLTCGLEGLGIKSLWAVEREEDYFRTYGFNFPNTKLITQDIRKVNPNTLDKVDIIVGGPPCQGFSLSGLRFKDDPRNEMYKEFVRFVSVLKPGEFLLENVPQIQSIEEDVIKDFNELGYEVEGFLVKGKDIGMRQHRNRYFFYGHN
jgi:site-specific DNA-cytosine methylase